MQCVPGWGDWIKSIHEFGKSLHRMTLDISSLSCMAALTMVTCEYIQMLFILKYEKVGIILTLNLFMASRKFVILSSS